MREGGAVDNIKLPLLLHFVERYNLEISLYSLIIYHKKNTLNVYLKINTTIKLININPRAKNFVEY